VTRPSTYTQTRYLEAKRTVDDRALHRPTLDALGRALDGRAEPIRIVEAGCGTGSMLRRLLAWDVLSDAVAYHGFDLDPAAVERAATALTAWGEAAGYTVDEETAGDALETTAGEAEATTVALTDEDGATVRATFAVDDVVARARRLDATYDLLVGCAVFDLLNLEDALEPLASLVPGGLVYAPITFDGETFFRSVATDGDAPVVRRERERAVIAAYHETMDAPTRPGGSRAGRELLEAVPAAGCRVRAAGAAGWLVTPPYPGDEAYFLHHLIDGIESAVVDARRAAAGTDRLAREAVRTWADRRHRAVSTETLAYGAHNLDVLAAVPDA
jgi:SAM-dependent methyltransferase